MHLQKARRILGLLILLASSVLLLWAVTPVATQIHVLPLLPANMQLPPSSSSPGDALPLAVPDNRLLNLKWPSRTRVGDVESIRVILRPDIRTDGRVEATNPQVAQLGSLENTQKPSPNVYDTHDVLVAARLDLPGMPYVPTGEVSQALRPGEPVTFLWQLRPAQAGSYRGTIWLHLRFISLDGKTESRSVLTAQPIEIQADTFLGLGGTPARLLGCIGVVTGVLMSLDFVFIYLWQLGLRKKGVDA